MDDRVIDPAAGVARGGYVTPDGGVAQTAWGWDATAAAPSGGEDVVAALTHLPSNPTLYTARQQDAVRRDLAARLGTYEEYRPQPFISD